MPIGREEWGKEKLVEWIGLFNQTLVDKFGIKLDAGAMVYIIDQRLNELLTDEAKDRLKGFSGTELLALRLILDEMNRKNQEAHAAKIAELQKQQAAQDLEKMPLAEKKNKNRKMEVVQDAPSTV